MNLLFKKSENQSELFIVKGESPESFDYIKMMKYLITGDNLEDSQFEGDYSAEEILKVNEMVNRIKETISGGDGHDEKLDDLPYELFSDSVEVESVDDEIRIENIPF